MHNYFFPVRVLLLCQHWKLLDNVLQYWQIKKIVKSLQDFSDKRSKISALNFLATRVQFQVQTLLTNENLEVALQSVRPLDFFLTQNLQFNGNFFPKYIPPLSKVLNRKLENQPKCWLFFYKQLKWDWHWPIPANKLARKRETKSRISMLFHAKLNNFEESGLDGAKQ